MRTKVTLVLIFLNVALFFFIFKFERNWRTEAASLEKRSRVLGPEAADIRSLEVSGPAAGGGFSLIRRRDTWMLDKPIGWPANPHAVSSILQELQLLENVTSFPTKDLGKNNNPSLADYGLATPKLVVAFTSGDPATATGPQAPIILRIGDATKVGNRLYVLSPDGERIHVVNRTLVDTLTLPIEQLRADALFTVPVFEVRSLTVQIASAGADQARGGVGTGARVRIRRDAARWSFETPIIARVSRPEVEITINLLNALRAKTFNPANVPATLPSAAPSIRIALEGNNRLETLFLGEPVPAPAAAPAASGETKAAPPAETEYFAQLEGRSVVFTVSIPAGLLDRLRNATEKLRETHLLDFDPNSVTAVTIASPVQSSQSPVTLQRLETAANAAEGGAWQIVRRGDGNQGLQTTPADRAAVQRVLTQLTQLAVLPHGFVSDNPSNAELEAWGFNRPEREITLTLAAVAASPAVPAPAGGSTAGGLGLSAGASGAGGAPIVLRLGTDAAGKVYARVGSAADAGSSIYAVDTDLRRTFPVEPLAWRDRALPLVPANARVSALKLTDLAAHQALVETPLDASGQPTAKLANPDAVRKVLAQFRTLHAKVFVQDHFTERVMAGGDERPWKYQLDVTITLPGGAGGEQTETKTLFLLERTGGAEQLAGSKDLDVVFEVEQAFLDPLWDLIYGPHDPGLPPEAKK